MNVTPDKKRKVMQSLSAFAFALTVFAANAQGGGVSAEEVMDAAAAGMGVAASAEHKTDADDGDEQSEESRDGGDTNGISNTYESQKNVKELLSAAQGYNVFIEGNYTQHADNVDMGDGKSVVAVGGSMNLNGTVASSIEVAGDLNAKGDVHANVIQGSACGIDFADTFASLRETSANIAANSSGVGITSTDPDNNIRFTGYDVVFSGNNDIINVFTLTVDEYNSICGSPDHAIRYNVPENSIVVVNIVGKGTVDLTVNGGAYFAGNALTSQNKQNNSQILVNVTEAETVKIGTSVGSLLAPNSDIVSDTNYGGTYHYEGQVIGKSFEGWTEFGSTAFNDTLEYEDGTTINPIKDLAQPQETPVEETPVEETPVEETPVEETPVEETPVEETPVEETPVEETPVEETPVEATPVEETPVEETPVEETPVEETPVEETPVEETPVEETPVEETPVEETPVEETPVEETPVEETPVEETPVEETPVEETPVEETPVEETPVEETPVEETPVEETP
ncbi:MAG: collagen-binding domain-containing protein, partial [Huintestinicola sp.]